MTDFNTLKTRLALAPAPRRVALDLEQYDTVETTKFLDDPVEDPKGVRIEIALVSFRHGPHRDAVSFYIYQDGRYSIGGSACVTTEHSKEHLKAFARALAFLDTYKLEPYTYAV